MLACSSLSQCDESEEHTRIVRLAVVVMGIWPIGATATCAFILMQCRSAIQQSRPTVLSRGCSFLHNDYNKKRYYWEIVVLLERITLSGMLLLVPHDRQLLRLVLATIVASLVTILTFYSMPYRRGQHDYMSCATQLILQLVFVGALLINIFTNITEYADADTAAKILSFDSTSQIVTMIMFATLGVLLAILALVITEGVEATPAPILCYEDGGLPELMLCDKQCYHTFISHIWSSGRRQKQPHPRGRP